MKTLIFLVLFTLFSFAAFCEQVIVYTPNMQSCSLYVSPTNIYGGCIPGWFSFNIYANDSWTVEPIIVIGPCIYVSDIFPSSGSGNAMIQFYFDPHQTSPICFNGCSNILITCGSETDTVSVYRDCPTNIENKTELSNSIKIHPNPNTGEFIIEMNITKATDLEIKLLNVVGQVIYQEKLNKYVGAYQKSIDIGEYAKGIYNLQLIGDEGIINRKIVVE